MVESAQLTLRSAGRDGRLGLRAPIKLLALFALSLLLMAPASADDLIAQWLQQDEVSGQTEEVRPDLNAITDEQWREMFAIGRARPDAFAQSQTNTFLVWLAILTAALALLVGGIRNWTEALEQWGPRRVQAELSRARTRFVSLYKRRGD